MTTPATLPVFDGHNDLLMRLYRRKAGRLDDFFAGETEGHIDLPRCLAGGFGGGLFAVFVPPKSAPAADSAGSIIVNGETVRLSAIDDVAYAQQATLAMMAILFRLEATSKGRVRVARSVADLQACLESGTLAAVLHIEGAEAIDPDLNALDVFYQAGLRSLGLVWSRPNLFGYGVPFAFPGSPDTGPGLTDAGRALVRACNRLGVLLDLSHLNEKGFWDVAALSEAPLVATHSNVHALCPATRNLTDRQLDAIRESDGLVGLNFNVGFLRPDGSDNRDMPLMEMIRHIDYLVERLGIDGVALGSDFDGATMPRDVPDVAGLPNLVAALAAHGYDEASLRKITSANWLRVLRKTWHEPFS